MADDLYILEHKWVWADGHLFTAFGRDVFQNHFFGNPIGEFFLVRFVAFVVIEVAEDEWSRLSRSAGGIVAFAIAFGAEFFVGDGFGEE